MIGDRIVEIVSATLFFAVVLLIGIVTIGVIQF